MPNCCTSTDVHQNRILHRDVKSLNVFLAADQTLRIGDFGVAKVLDTKSQFAHTLVGTPYFLSPELLSDCPYNGTICAIAMVCYPHMPA